MKRMTHMIVNFANGQHVVELAYPRMRVKAIRSASHGDWKTQLVRREFIGMREGEEGDLESVWDNFEGRWCRVLFDGKSADIAPRDLEAIPNA